MRARVVRFHEPGAPEVLRVEELPVAAPRPGQVLLRVRAVGLNRVESAFRQGRFSEAPSFPSRIGYEAAGVVEAVGPDVVPCVGATVCTLPAFSMSAFGVYGEHAVVPARALAPWPSELGAEQAAALWTAHLTAWASLVDCGRVEAGQTVLITGAAGAVGLAAIQVARLAGARVVAATRQVHRRDALRLAGAHHVVVLDEEDLPARVRALTAGRGVDLVLDAIGGPALARWASVAAHRARIVLHAVADGVSPLPARALYDKGLTLVGCNVFHVTYDAEKLAAAERYILDGVRTGKLRPVVERVFSLDDIVAAHRHLDGSRPYGKVVVAL